MDETHDFKNNAAPDQWSVGGLRAELSDNESTFAADGADGIIACASPSGCSDRGRTPSPFTPGAQPGSPADASVFSDAGASTTGYGDFVAAGMEDASAHALDLLSAAWAQAGIHPTQAARILLSARRMYRARDVEDIVLVGADLLAVWADVGGQPPDIVAAFARELFGSFVPCGGTDDYNFLRIVEALLTGRTSPTWPTYIQTGVAMLWRLSLGSVALYTGARILPEAVRAWLAEYERPDGAFAVVLIKAAEDLLARCTRAWHERRLAALFEPRRDEPLAILTNGEMLLATPTDRLLYGEDPQEYYGARIALVQESQRALLKLARRDTTHTERVLRLFRGLESRVQDYEAALGRTASRDPPLALLLFSAPRVGKTAVAECLHTAISSAWAINDGRDAIYHGASDKFHDMYSARLHTTVFADDLLPENPDRATAASESVGTLITWLNAATKPLNVAFEGKGKVFAAPKLFIASSNVKHLNAAAYATAGGTQLLGRFPNVITVEVKEEFRRLNSCELDASLVVVGTEPWNFLVERATLFPDATGVRYDEVGRFDTVAGLCDWAAQLARAHAARSSTYGAAVEAHISATRERVRERAAQIVLAAAAEDVCARAVATSGTGGRGAVLPPTPLQVARIERLQELVAFGALGCVALAISLVCPPVLLLDVRWFPTFFIDAVLPRGYYWPVTFCLLLCWVCALCAYTYPGYTYLSSLSFTTCFAGGATARQLGWAPAPGTFGERAMDAATLGCAAWVDTLLQSMYIPLRLRQYFFLKASVVLVAAELIRGRRVATRIKMAAAVLGVVVAAWSLSRYYAGATPAPVCPTAGACGADAPVVRAAHDWPDIRVAARADVSGWEASYRASTRRALQASGQQWQPPPAVYTGGLVGDPSIRSAASVTMSRDDALARVRGNLVRFRLEWKEGEVTMTETGTAAHVHDGWFATSAHIFPAQGNGTWSLRLLPGEVASAGLGTSLYALSLGVNLAMARERDEAVFQLPLRNHRSMLGLLPRNELDLAEVSAGSKFVFWGPLEAARGAVERHETTVRAAPHVARVSATSAQRYGTFVTTVLPPEPGASGGFGLLTSGRQQLAIGPVFGYTRFGGGTTPHGLFATMFQAGFLALVASTSRAKDAGELGLEAVTFVPCSSAATRPVPGLSLHPRSWLSALGPLGFPAVFRGVVPARISARFRVAETPLAPHLTAMVDEFDARHAAPLTGGVVQERDGALEWSEPFLNNMRGVLGPREPPPEAADWAARDYLAAFPDASTHPDGRKWRVLTPQEAVFGCPEFGIAPMDLSKSAGPIFRGKKRDHVVADGAGGWALTPVLLAAVENRLAELLPGDDGTVMGAVPAIWTLKEELKPVGKVEKTRAFNVLCFVDLIVQRMYISPVLAYMGNTTIGVRECAVGTNAADPEQWGGLADHLQGVDDPGFEYAGSFDMDISKYDKHLFAWLSERRARTVAGLARKAGFAPAEVRDIYAIALAYGYTDAIVDGVVLSLFQQEPSGAIATAEFNSIDLATLLRVCLWILWKQRYGYDAPLPAFRDVVKALEYGDDNVSSPTRRIADWFNQRTVAAVLASLHFKATPAAKSAELGGVFPITEVTFLKRRFVPRDGLWYAPLEEVSILKQLSYAVRRGTVPDDVRDASCVDNALREAFLHGRAFYERLRAALPPFPLSAAGGYDCRPQLPEFDELHRSFVARGLRTWDSGGQMGPVLPETVADASVDAVACSGSAPASASGGVDHDAEGGSHAEHAVAIFERGVASVSEVVGTKVAVPRTVGGYTSWWERPLVISSSTITGAAVTLELAVWSIYLQLQAVVRKAANHRFLRASMRIHLQVTGTPMHYGLLKVGYFPAYGQSETQGAIVHQQVMQLPGPLLDLSTSPSAEFIVPLIIPGRYLDLEANPPELTMRPDRAGSLFVYSAKVLQHATLATPPPVGLVIRANLVDAVFAGPTSSYFATVTSGSGGGGVPEFSGSKSSFHSEQTFEGVVSAPATLVAGALARLGEVPFIGPLAMAASMVAQGVAGVAAFFGYSKPISLRFAERVVVQPHADMASYKALDWVPSGSLDPAIAVTLDAGASGASREDMMSLSYLKSREGMCFGSVPTASEWASTAARGTVLASIPVCPMVIDRGNGDVITLNVLPPVGFAASGFAQWSGSLVYRIRVVASAFHTGRLVVYYTSTSATETQLLEPTAKHSVVVDIAKDRELYVRVGWQQPTLVGDLPRTLPVVPNSAYAATLFTNAYANGTLSIAVDSVLNGQLATSAVGLLVSVMGADDLAFFGPNPEFMYAASVTSGSGGGGSALTERSAPPVVVDLVPTLARREDAFHCQGELFDHIRPLLTRYAPAFGWRRTKNAATDVALSMWSVSFPRSLYGTPGYRSAEHNVGTRYVTPYEYYRTAFLGERGAVRYRVFQSGAAPAASADPGLIGVSCLGPRHSASGIAHNYGVTTAAGFVRAPIPASRAHMGLTLSRPSADEPIGIQSPFRGPYYFQTRTLRTADGATFGFDEAVNMTVTFSDTQTAAANTDHYYSVWQCCGDDFTFVHFTCTPKHSTTGPFPN